MATEREQLTARGNVYLGPTAFKKLQSLKYNQASLLKRGSGYYLAPNEAKRLGFTTPTPDVVNTDVQYNAGAGFDPTSFAQQLAAQLRAASPSVARPTFDASGLYSEADAKAQAEAEFNPYFQDQEKLQGKTQEGQRLGLLQSYLQRGLAGKTGGEIAANQNLTEEQQRAQAALKQKKAGALEDYRKNAYNQAWTQYLAQFS